MHVATTLLRHSFRRRLALFFVLVAAFSAGALALGAIMVSSSYRHRAFAERARLDARQDLALWSADDPPQLLIRRLEPFARPGGPGVLVVTNAETHASVDTLSLSQIPDGMRVRTLQAAGALTEQTTEIAGDRYLVIGQSLGRQGAEVYFFYSKAPLLDGIRDVQITLLVGWLLVTAAAAFVGTVIARRTLRPVQEAADAANSVAEGLLETRLRVAGRDEFAQWSNAFNEMVAALQEKVTALAEARDRERRFNADAAHELRTPLGTVVTAATLLHDHADRLPPEMRRPTELVVEGARRLTRLVDELLELHMIDAGQMALEWEEVDLGAAVSSAVLGHGWEDLVSMSTGGAVTVSADRWRLDRIVINLISNALHHGGPPVEVEVECSDGRVTLAVTDHGPGIPQSERERIFDRYVKVSAARTTLHAPHGAASGGSGLGLAIALQNAKLLGGDLTLTTEPGRTTFSLHLPVLDPQDAAQRADDAQHV